MKKQEILSANAPRPIGTYSQAIRDGSLVFLSAQAPLVPETSEVVAGDAAAQIMQAFVNLVGVAEAAGGSTDHIAKITVYLTDLSNFPTVNAVMADLFRAPYPARAVIGVAALPRGTQVAVEAVMSLSS